MFMELERRAPGETLTRGSPFQFREHGPGHFGELKIGKWAHLKVIGVRGGGEMKAPVASGIWNFSWFSCGFPWFPSFVF